MIPEIAKPGSKIGNVYATDADDVGMNSKIQYYITSGSNSDIKIDRVSGELFVVGNLVPTTNYLLNISAVDGGGLASRTTVNISVVGKLFTGICNIELIAKSIFFLQNNLDINNNKPIFDQNFYQYEIFEGNYTSDKAKLGVLRARDEDYGKNAQIEYTMANSVPADFTQKFAIDSATGELFAIGFIDREQKDVYKFLIQAIDGGEPPLNSTAEVLIRIKVTLISSLKNIDH